MDVGVRSKPTVGGVLFSIINYTVLIGFTIICVFPFYYIFINTISNNELSAAGEIVLIPRGIHFNNYLSMRDIPGLFQAAYISVARTAIGTIATVVAAAFLGFLFTREMFGRKVFYRMLIASMYFNAGLIPYFITIMRMGLLNNFLVYVIPLIVQPFSVLLVKTYIESTPISLQESAEIDGAGPFRIFVFIVLPLTKPILATVAIFAAVGQWNSFMDTVLFITDERLWTLQFVLHRYISQAGFLARLLQAAQAGVGTVDIAAIMATQQTPTSVRMTVTMVATLPILLVYPFFQKYFTKGIMMGAVKG